jgi:hypothetical protein
MADTMQPPKAVENWQQVRDDWVAELNRVIAEAEEWAHQRGWGTLRDDRTIRENEIGSYRVPVLLIHTMKGRVLITPEARFVFGADGLIDVSVYPSLDTLTRLVRTPDGWRFTDAASGELADPWSAESLAETITRGLEAQ